MHVKARGQCWLSPSLSLHFNFWGQASHWIHSLPVQLASPSQPLVSTPSHPPALITATGHGSSFLHLVGDLNSDPYGKHFTNWVVSPDPWPIISTWFRGIKPKSSCFTRTWSTGLSPQPKTVIWGLPVSICSSSKKGTKLKVTEEVGRPQSLVPT